MNALFTRLSISPILVLAMFAIPASAQDISGIVSSDTTWTSAGPVVVTGTVTIPSGITLTIQPGTTVRFQPGTGLIVGGTLLADGSAANPITFTSAASSPAPGGWAGIEFQNSVNVGTVIDYCVVEYAGGGGNNSAFFYKTGAFGIPITNCTVRFSSNHGINTRASTPAILNTTVARNNGYGIYSDLVTNMTIDSCTIVKNTSGGIRIPVNSSPTVTNSDIDSNGIGIFIDNSSSPAIRGNRIRWNTTGIQFTGLGTTQPMITANTIADNSAFGFLNTGTSVVVAERNGWGSESGPYHPGVNPTGTGNPVSDYVDFQPWSLTSANLPVTQITTSVTANTAWISGVYWIKNSISVNGGVTLTIAPGSVVKFAPNARLTVNGTIVAAGSVDSLIVFTSDKDDSYAGDSNGDGAASGPSPGNWDMVYLNGGGNSASILRNCLFKFGGSGGDGNLRVNSSTPEITGMYSNNSSSFGAYFYFAPSTVRNSAFSGNASRGVYLYSSNASFVQCTLNNNGNIGLLADGASRIRIQHCVVKQNISTGIHVDGGGNNATIVLLDSTQVSNNTGTGVYNFSATGSQVFSNNLVQNNGGTGLHSHNLDSVITIANNRILNNSGDALVTSKASILSNTIQGNRYPIAFIGRLGSAFSGNTITGNQFNSAIGLRNSRESFFDTLKAAFPAGLTASAYVMTENSNGIAVAGGTTLVVEPGVIVKMDAGTYWRVDGVIIADGTPQQPIVFTSYRDASYGGKTNAAGDNNGPAPGDWRYIRVRTSGAAASVLDHVIFKFGGTDNYGNLWFDNVTPASPISNIVSRRSSGIGIRAGNAQLTFSNSVIDSNGSYGMYLEGSSPRSDVTLLNCLVNDNNGTGLQAVDYSTYRQVSNCSILRNNGHGVGIDNGTVPQVFVGNMISVNNGYGIYTNSPSLPFSDIQFIGNTFADNAADGVLSTAARFIDNTIRNNRFPISVWGRQGNSYVDNNGVDGNIIMGNQYNAIALRGGSGAPLFDTLKNVFPAGIPSHTYAVIEDIRINAGATLVIQPGVIVKMQYFGNAYRSFNIYGTLIAEASHNDPIIFTSWRDSTVGGKTTLPTDYAPPAPGDWYYIAFRDGSGNSVVRNCQFKYGGRDGSQAVYLERNLGSLVFSHNLVRRSLAGGIIVGATQLTIDSTLVDSCQGTGIRLYDNTLNIVRLRGCVVTGNTAYGVWAEGSGKFSLIQDCDIIGNTNTGLYILNNTVPLSIISNRILRNGDHGMYVLARNDAVDTLLIIANNKVRDNGLVGIFSSRAFVIDDSITGNRYAIGVTGQLSLDGSTNNAGNIYQGNVIANNRYNDVLLTQENIFGRLGLSYPAGYRSNVVAIRGNAYVPAGLSLMIAPGTVIKFPLEYGDAGHLRVDGSVLCEGTSAAKIVFTSWRDDTFGGDSNGDSSVTVPGMGDWQTVHLNGGNNASSHFLHTLFRYGGRNGDGAVKIQNVSMTVESCAVSFSNNDGIRFFSSNGILTGSEIRDNRLAGVAVFDPSNPVIRLNNIYRNGTGLYTDSRNSPSATPNYWGAASGPFVNQGTDQNLSGTGNRIQLAGSGGVTYRPFLTSRSGILIGDVSENGTITSFDASLILRSVVGLDSLRPNQRIAADVTADGTVSSLDASYILRFVVGLVTGFPGLGKSAGSTDSPSIVFTVEQGTSPDEIFLVARASGMGILATEAEFSFDSRELSPGLLTTAALISGFSVVQNAANGTLSVAAAGTDPTRMEGELFRIPFTRINPSRVNIATTISIVRSLVNEQRLKEAQSDITVSRDLLRGLPLEFGLSQNYPNPFNPSTAVNYELPTVSTVSLKVFDMLGREVAVLANGLLQAGYHTAVWNGTDGTGSIMASGIYLIRMEASGEGTGRRFTSMKKLVLVK